MEDHDSGAVGVRLEVGYELLVDETALREHLIVAAGLDRSASETATALGDVRSMVERLDPAELAVTPGVTVVRTDRVARSGTPDAGQAADRGWGPVVRRLVRGLTTWD